MKHNIVYPREAKTLFCPIIKDYCKGDECMMWYGEWFDKGAGRCGLMPEVKD